MSRKHHAIYSDPTGAAAAGSPAKRRASRTKESASETPSSNPAPSASEVIDRQAIARLAYSYWAARGYSGGSAEEDWLRAEHELRTGRATAAVA